MLTNVAYARGQRYLASLDPQDVPSWIDVLGELAQGASLVEQIPRE